MSFIIVFPSTFTTLYHSFAFSRTLLFLLLTSINGFQVPTAGMLLITAPNSALSALSSSLPILPHILFRCSSISPANLPFPFLDHRFPSTSNNSLLLRARKRNSESQPVLKQNIVQEVSEDEEDDVLFDEFEQGKTH